MSDLIKAEEKRPVGRPRKTQPAQELKQEAIPPAPGAPIVTVEQINQAIASGAIAADVLAVTTAQGFNQRYSENMARLGNHVQAATNQTYESVLNTAAEAGLNLSDLYGHG